MKYTPPYLISARAGLVAAALVLSAPAAHAQEKVRMLLDWAFQGTVCRVRQRRRQGLFRGRRARCLDRPRLMARLMR